MQWLGKIIGFEKISLKKNTFKGYFISNQQSAYFETEQFNRVLQFVQAHPRICNLREVKNSLRLAVEHVGSVESAIDILQEIVIPIKELQT